jgi:glycogen(starch) synthase
MLGWEFPPAITGGLAVATEGLVRGFLRTGARVSLILPRSPGPLRLRGLKVIDASVFGRPPDRRPALASSYASNEGAAYGPGLVTQVLQTASAAGQIALREQCDVIHAHDWLTFPAGLEARRVSGRPLVVHVHSTEADRAGLLESPFIRSIERQGVRLADRVIAVSRATADRLASTYGVPHQRIRVVHNAIDASGARHRHTASAGRPPLVLFAGRLTRQKGPEFFLEAAALVAREIPRARFVVAGAGELLPAMMARAEALGMERQVVFKGFLPPAKLARLYSTADLFVSPSVSEPFGLAALEALAHGTPAIVSRRAGVTEVVRNVLQVDHGDTDDLAAKMIAVLLLPKVGCAFALRGRAEVLRLSWKSSAEKCLRICGEILGPGLPASTRRSGRRTPRISRSWNPGA